MSETISSIIINNSHFFPLFPSLSIDMYCGKQCPVAARNRTFQTHMNKNQGKFCLK